MTVMTVKGFVRTCVVCAKQYAIFNEPVPKEYAAYSHSITRETYERNIKHIESGVCGKCAPAPDFSAFSWVEVLELLLEAENRKHAYIRARKHVNLETLVEEYGEGVHDFVPREERFIKHCETELEKRESTDEPATEKTGETDASKRTFPFP